MSTNNKPTSLLSENASLRASLAVAERKLASSIEIQNGVLRILHQHGIKPSSTEICEAADGAAVAERDRQRLITVLGEDLAGRPLAELLTICADKFHEQGGGPLVDCLRAKAQAIDSAMNNEPASGIKDAP